MFLRDGQPFNIDAAFTVGEGEQAVQFLAGTARLASFEERLEWGITEVPDPPHEVAPPRVSDVIGERARRFALGFDHDFGDARGVHHIGTTPEDMVGWDEVTKGAQAAILLGAPETAINIVTNTGPVTITAMEWQSVLAHATLVRQPLWAASFVLQAMDPIPADFADDSYWD